MKTVICLLLALIMPILAIAENTNDIYQNIDSLSAEELQFFVNELEPIYTYAKSKLGGNEDETEKGVAINLSGLKYEELVALKDDINMAIWNSETWQQVKVPHGVWVVGEDIPAGKWTISVDDEKDARVDWGDKLDPSGWDFEWGTIWNRQFLHGENYKYNSGNYPPSITWDLKDGHFIIVQEGEVYFTPYAGKPSLGFK